MNKIEMESTFSSRMSNFHIDDIVTSDGMKLEYDDDVKEFLEFTRKNEPIKKDPCTSPEMDLETPIPSLPNTLYELVSRTLYWGYMYMYGTDMGDGHYLCPMSDQYLDSDGLTSSNIGMSSPNIACRASLVGVAMCGLLNHKVPRDTCDRWGWKNFAWNNIVNEYNSNTIHKLKALSFLDSNCEDSWGFAALRYQHLGLHSDKMETIPKIKNHTYTGSKEFKMLLDEIRHQLPELKMKEDKVLKINNQ